MVLTGLSKRNIKSLYIANRTVSKAEELAKRYNGKAIELESIEHYLAKSDIIIVATDAKNHLITKEMVLKTIQEEKSIQKQLYIDLSVPRNIEESVNKLTEKQLYAVDGPPEILKPSVSCTAASRPA